jgi:hypothetical protein
MLTGATTIRPNGGKFWPVFYKHFLESFHTTFLYSSYLKWPRPVIPKECSILTRFLARLNAFDILVNLIFLRAVKKIVLDWIGSTFLSVLKQSLSNITYTRPFKELVNPNFLPNALLRKWVVSCAHQWFCKKWVSLTFMITWRFLPCAGVYFLLTIQ